MHYEIHEKLLPALIKFVKEENTADFVVLTAMFYSYVSSANHIATSDDVSVSL